MAGRGSDSNTESGTEYNVSATIKVVIADDHESVRAGIAAILGTDPKIEIVAQASDGFEAVLECVKHGPDVALVDLRMPNKDGIWATERITSQTQTRVLILTTYDSDDLIAQALAAGAHGYLLKSTSGTELILGVRHVAQNRHVLDPAIVGSMLDQMKLAGAAVAPEGNDLDQLTQRERDVLNLLAQGLTNQKIAEHLGVGITTVKTHVGALYTKTGVASRIELSRLAH